MTPPNWVIALIECATTALGLEAWDIYTIQQQGMDRMAMAELQPEYEVATILVDTATVDDHRGNTAILHEMVHVQHGPLYLAHEQVLRLVPKKHRKLAQQIFSNADELVVQREARAWYYQLSDKNTAGSDIGGCTSTTCCGIITAVDADQESPIVKEKS